METSKKRSEIKIISFVNETRRDFSANANFRCGCVPHFYPETGGFRHCSIKELDCVGEHLEEIRATDRCSCELGCSNTVYEVEKLNENGLV